MGGQAAINLIAKSGVKHLEYIRLKPNAQSIDEMEQILYLLRQRNFCDPKCNFELGSTRLFTISARLLKPTPDEIETLEIINKAKETKTDFGDLDIGIRLREGITPSIVADFFNTVNPSKYVASTNGTEVSIAVCLEAYPNKVIQIDLVCMKDEAATTFNHFASMADMAVGIKGVVRDVLIRSIASCYPIKDDLMDILRQSVKTSEACKAFSEKYKNNKPNFRLRYSMMAEGLAYHITWLVDGKEKTFSMKGIDMNYLHKIHLNILPIGFDEMEMISKTLGFDNPRHLYHATTMAKVIGSYDAELRQKIWDKFTDTMKTKTSTSTRIVGQITEAELTTALRYLKPHFNLPMQDSIKMPSIPHWDQMTPSQYEKLLDGNYLEVSEKYDGSNVSFGVNGEGKIYVRSKRGIAITDPNEFDDMAVLYDNDIFHGFADLLRVLKDIHFKNICPHGVQIFGEMFCKARMNVIEYDPKIINTGLVVIFGFYKNGEDIYATGDLTRTFARLSRAVYNKSKWDFRLKRCAYTGLDYDKLKRFHNPESLQMLKSRNRTDEGIKKHKEQFRKFLIETKRELLPSINGIQSSLGASEVEGLIVKNPLNGAMAKIVDLDDFGARRLEQWAGMGKIKEFRKEVYKELIDNIPVLSADVFILDTKQHQKIQEAMELKGLKFDNIDQVINVLIGDAVEEIPHSSLDFINGEYFEKLEVWLLHHRIKMFEYKEALSQDNPQAYQEMINAFNIEEQNISTLQSGLYNSPLTEIIKYILGMKAINNFEKLYVINRDIKRTVYYNVSIN